MKRTLLEMTQEILSAMGSDEVNSITDTVESNSVALLIKGVYYDIATELDLCEHHSLFELNASGDSTQPTLMTVPSNVTNIEWVEYDVIEADETVSNYERIRFSPLDEFLTAQNALRNDDTTAAQIEFTLNGEVFSTYYNFDRKPHCYTTVDDYTLLFDAYNADVDTTLQKNKTRCSGSLIPTFSMVDTFTPDFNPQQFAYFLNKCKVRAFAELKQAENAEAGKEARNQKIILQKRKRIVENTPEVFRVGARYGRITPMQAPGTIPNYLKQGN